MSISRFHTNCLAAAAVLIALLCTLGANASPASAATAPQPAAKAPAARSGDRATPAGAVGNVFRESAPNSTWFAHVDIQRNERLDGAQELGRQHGHRVPSRHRSDPHDQAGRDQAGANHERQDRPLPGDALHYDVVNPLDMSQVWGTVTATVNSYVTIVPREWEAYVEGKVDSGADYMTTCKYDGGDPTDNPQGVGGTVNFGPFRTGDKQQMRCYRP